MDVKSSYSQKKKKRIETKKENIKSEKMDERMERRKELYETKDVIEGGGELRWKESNEGKK